MADEKCYIVFIRKVNEPDKSFYAMEIKENKVVQVRGHNNCEQTKDIKLFVEDFKRKVLRAA